MSVDDQSKAISIEGRTLDYRAIGSGPPLLLINGYAATAADWDPAFLAHLGESHQLICRDNRGVGDSELGEPDRVSIEAMAEDVLALMDALGLEVAPVVGWSRRLGPADRPHRDAARAGEPPDRPALSRRSRSGDRPRFRRAGGGRARWSL